MQRLFRAPQRGQQPKPPGFLNLHCVAISKTQYFKPKYSKRCNELLEAACTKAKSVLPPAIERLAAIVQDDTQQPREQIAACRALCEYSLRLNEAVDIEQRLRALEERGKNET